MKRSRYNDEAPLLAEICQFAAAHYFAMCDGKSNGETRPVADIDGYELQRAQIIKADVANPCYVTLVMWR